MAELFTIPAHGEVSLGPVCGLRDEYGVTGRRQCPDSHAC